MRVLTLLVVLGGLAACGPRKNVVLTPQDHAYLDRLDSVRTTFVLPADVSDIAWERARNFIDRYSWVMLHSASENEIRTFNPPAGSNRCGYVIRRKRKDDKVEFRVECVAGRRSALGTVNRNARILSRYMQTGELPPDDKLITK